MFCYKIQELKQVCSPVTTTECSSPHATSTILSLRIQNLLAKLSANLLLPNVKTAPVSGKWGKGFNLLLKTKAKGFSFLLKRDMKLAGKRFHSKLYCKTVLAIQEVSQTRNLSEIGLYLDK